MSNGPETTGYIFDTTCLNYFCRTGHLQLLEKRYRQRAFIPREVHKELRDGAALHPELRTILKASWFEIIRLELPEDFILFDGLLKRWGKDRKRNRGEAATLVLAKRLGHFAVIDELVGRNAAVRLGVDLIGTVGILAGMVREDEITEDAGWNIHEAMVSINPNGYRSPLSTKDQFTQLCRGA